MIDPLLRHAVTFVRRAPGWTLAVAVAAAALAATSATPPLVADAAADRAFVAEVQVSSGAQPGRGLDARAVTTGVFDAAAITAVDEELDALPIYGAPRARIIPTLPYADLTGVPVIRNRAGDEVTAIVISLDGAIDGLASDGQSTERGIWVPDTTAAELGIAPGDRVEVALQRPAATPETAVPPVPVRVAGVYATNDGLPVIEGTEWSSLPGGPPDDPVVNGRPARMLFADRATALSLINAMGDVSLITWDLAWDGAIDVEHGRRAAAPLDDTGRRLRNRESVVGAEIAAVGGEPVQLNSGLESFVERSERAAAELQPLVTSIALTGRVMSGLVLAVGTWLLTRSRRRELQLSMSMGIHPVRLALTVVVELLVALVVGIAIAGAIVRWQPQWVAGNGTIDTRTIRDATSVVIRSFPLAAGVVVAAAFAALWPLEPSSAGRARRVAGVVHADTMVVVAAVATGAQLVTQRGRTLDSGTSLLFPLFAELAGAVIVVRLIAAIGGRVGKARARRRKGRRSRRPRSLALWLAGRRASSWLGELSALVIVVAAGVGLFVYSTSVAVAGEQGVSDKAAALGGAVSTVPIASTDTMTIGSSGLPVGLSPGWTVLWSTTTVHVGPELVTDLLIVDPTTFPDAVDWRSSFAGPSLPTLLSSIDDGNAATIDVILAGNYEQEFPDNGTMELDRAFVRYRVVARIAAAPWIRERSSMMLVSARRFASVLPVDPNLDPPLTLAGTLDRRYRTYVWAEAPATEVTTRFASVVLDDDPTPDTVTARRTPAFVAFEMSLPYLRIVGLGLLAVALVSIVVLGARRRSDLAMEIAMTDRMGIPPRTTAVAVAGGAVLLGLIGSLIGIVLARQLVVFMIHRLDPGPSFAPGFSGGLAPSAVAVAVGAVVLVSLAGSLWEVRGARRARVVEVLRGVE